jgi:hypothetical protein
MTILNKIYATLATIGSIIVAGFVLFFLGKSKGKEEARAKQNEEVLDAVTKTKEAIDLRADDSIDVVRERVRSHNRD